MHVYMLIIISDTKRTSITPVYNYHIIYKVICLVFKGILRVRRGMRLSHNNITEEPRYTNIGIWTMAVVNYALYECLLDE